MKNISLLVLSIFYSLFLVAQDMQAVRKSIEILSSPQFYGRGYVNKGDSIAADFIQDKFSELNLSKLKSLNSYFQKYSFNVNTFPNQASIKLGNQKLIIGRDYIFSPSAPSTKGKYKIEVIDTMLFNSGVLKQNFLKKDLSKKALVISPEIKKILKFASKELRQKVYSAPVLINIIPEKLTASVSETQTKPLQIDILKSYQIINNSKLKINLETQVLNNHSTQNVVGFVEGKLYPDSFLVVCAHYDHLGQMGKSIYFPGANDNAAGIAMLIEFAKYFKSNPHKYSVLFIAFSGEEIGLKGSEYFVKNCPVELSKIKFLMNLDLVGTGENGATVVNGSIFKRDFEILNQINEEKKYLSLIKPRAKAPNSDHYLFTEKGVPSFFLYLMGNSKAYHDIDDTYYNLTLNKFEDCFRLITDFLNSK